MGFRQYEKINNPEKQMTPHKLQISQKEEDLRRLAISLLDYRMKDVEEVSTTELIDECVLNGWLNYEDE